MPPRVSTLIKNGLPADDQISSARDLAILARALIREFPEYDYYWHLPGIRMGKMVQRNYNSLIGRYPGADGKFGRNDPKLYNDQDNPVGVDPKDPAGKDDVTSVGLLVVPVNKPVNLILRSKDVTHDFFVPGLRFKQDTVPGMKISVYFTPIKEGRFEVACAELCGLGHQRMRAFMEVKSQAEFEKWLKERATQ